MLTGHQDKKGCTLMDITTTATIGEVYMVLKDRKRLARLMEIQGVSQRDLAKAAGWKSHSYVGRLLDGKAKTLKTDSGSRIANKLQVAVDDLFLVKVTSPASRYDQSRSAA